MTDSISRTGFKAGLLTSSAFLSAFAISAQAQTEAPAPAPSSAIEVVSVTASRAGGSGFAAPSPTTVIGADDIAQRQATNIATVLDENPAFKPTTQPSGNAIRTQQIGAATADLYGLGAQRTLVLVDGARVVPQAPANNTGAVVSPDLNQIPSLMIQRVEVVTGGASAQWGSDAVAGVVNVILRTDFEGFEATVQGGESSRGDNGNTRAALLGGIKLWDDVHIVAGLDYAKSGSVGDLYTRPWGAAENFIVSNAAFATNGLPANLIVGNVHSSLSPGGLITSGPLNGQAFDVGGLTTSTFQKGSINTATVMIGGQGQSLSKGVWLVPAVERVDPYVRAEYQLNNDTMIYAEIGYAWVRGFTHVLPSRDSADVISTNTTQQYGANAYLPPSVLAAYAGIPSFTINRVNYDLGNAQGQVTNSTPRILLGANGDLFGSWNWDAHISWGENFYTQNTFKDRIKPNFTFATDAVLNNGQIVCRATLPGPAFNAAAAGCVPINLFGAGSPSATAVAYATGTAVGTNNYIQTTAAANLHGEPSSTWAGPVSLAAGFEFRRESSFVGGNAQAVAGVFEAANSQTYRGAFDVKEGYVETIVPLAKDMSFAKSLDFNAAIRYAVYSSAGDQTTWKFGSSYEPFTGLRLRATISRDIRAPALYELDSPGANSSLPVTVKGITVASIPQNSAVGNPNLKPEIAITRTYGGVFEPTFLPGLGASVDYYDVNLKNAITSLLGSQAAAFCNSGIQFYCNAFTFTPAGVPTSYTLGVQNLASVHTQGLDIALNYHTPLSEFASQIPGSLRIGLSATYNLHSILDPGTGGAPIDRSGENAATNAFSVPKLRTNWTVTYELERASITAQIRTISKGNQDNTFNTTAALSVNNNIIPAMTYLNLQASYDLQADGMLKIFGGINNVLDAQPPPAPSALTFTNVNGVYYDVIGRAFQIGLKYKY